MPYHQLCRSGRGRGATGGKSRSGAGCPAPMLARNYIREPSLAPLSIHIPTCIDKRTMPHMTKKGATNTHLLGKVHAYNPWENEQITHLNGRTVLQKRLQYRRNSRVNDMHDITLSFLHTYCIRATLQGSPPAKSMAMVVPSDLIICKGQLKYQFEDAIKH